MTDSAGAPTVPTILLVEETSPDARAVMSVYLRTHTLGFNVIEAAAADETLARAQQKHRRRGAVEYTNTKHLGCNGFVQHIRMERPRLKSGRSPQSGTASLLDGYLAEPVESIQLRACSRGLSPARGGAEKYSRT